MVKFDAVFRVYGDNILECEHFIDWLLHPEAKLRFEGTEGAIDRPLLSFIDLYSNKRMGFQICPYYGGTGKTTLWSNNPLNDVFDEKVDVLITRVNSNLTESRPLIAIEFVDALMAGNQGWQRFRRATNAAKAQIAYFYVQPLIGWERDAEGLKLKNPRFLPAQTCLAQLSLCSKFGFPSLQIYTKSAWSEYAEKRGYPLPAGYEKFKGVDSAVKIVTSLLRLNIEKKSLEAILKQAYTDILSEMFAVAKTYSRYCNSSLPIHSNHQALKNPELSARIYAEALVNRSPVKGNIGLHTIDEKDFEQSGALFYKDAQKKTSSNNFNNNILSMLNWKSSMEITQCQRYLNCWGISPRGYCSTQKFKKLSMKHKTCLPLTYKSTKAEACLIKRRKELRVMLTFAYPKLSKDILNWVFDDHKNEKPSALFVVPLYAYKPSGDSRPDRGLLPLLWAMFPSLVRKDNTLVIIYSKHTPSNWKEILNQRGNELWNSILEFSGALIVDKTGDGLILK